MNALSQSQMVLVIQDASSSSSHVCTSAIKMALKQMFLHPGDEITFLAILDWFTTPSVFLTFFIYIYMLAFSLSYIYI